MAQQLLSRYELQSEKFDERFQNEQTFVDPFARLYRRVFDKNLNIKAVYKHYLSETQDQQTAVLDNLINYSKLDEQNGICKLLAFTNKQSEHKQILAAFQYDDYTLPEFMKRDRTQFYVTIMREMTEVIKGMCEIQINLDELSYDNLLVYASPSEQPGSGQWKIKVFYDELQKSYDKIIEGLKTFTSKEKLQALLSNDEQYFNNLMQLEDSISPQMLYQLALLLIDFMYQAQTNALNANSASNASLPDSSEFQRDAPIQRSVSLHSRNYDKSYYIVEYEKVHLDEDFLQLKLKFLSQLSHNHLVNELTRICQRILTQNANDRMSLLELQAQMERLSKILQDQKKSVINNDISLNQQNSQSQHQHQHNIHQQQTNQSEIKQISQHEIAQTETGDNYAGYVENTTHHKQEHFAGGSSHSLSKSDIQVKNNSSKSSSQKTLSNKEIEENGSKLASEFSQSQSQHQGFFSSIAQRNNSSQQQQKVAVTLQQMNYSQHIYEESTENQAITRNSIAEQQRSGFQQISQNNIEPSQKQSSQQRLPQSSNQLNAYLDSNTYSNENSSRSPYPFNEATDKFVNTKMTIDSSNAQSNSVTSAYEEHKTLMYNSANTKNQPAVYSQFHDIHKKDLDYESSKNITTKSAGDSRSEEIMHLNSNTNIETNKEFAVSNVIIPRQQLMYNLKAHESIKIALQNTINQLEQIPIKKKEYYDNSVYYGQTSPETNKRSGLGIYIYAEGDVYYGNWQQNSLINGTYVFKNGETYEGTVNKGKQGWGRYRYINGNVYEGEWKDDIKSGQGTMFYPNSDKYEGSWSKGKKNGFGKYYYNNGTLYQGNFVNGRKNGFGTIFFPNGTRIEANWQQTHVQGNGKVYYPNGDFFEGEYHLSEKNGKGLYVWDNEQKSRYEGDFKKDSLEGQARIHFTNKQYYHGRIKNGRRDGQGQYCYQNGDRFEGEWKNDMKLIGKYRFINGDQYQGRFKQNQLNFGVIRYANGQEYEGQFQQGLRHGVGSYRDAHGSSVCEGYWQNDRFVSKN